MRVYPGIRILAFPILMLFLFLQVCSLASAEESAVSTDNSKGIYYKEGFLKVSVEKQKFIEVMDEITMTAGIKIISKDYADEEVTIHFDYLPLEEGLRQLIVDKNYIFLYQSVEDGSPARLSTVFILPKKGDGTNTTKSASYHESIQSADRENEASKQQDIAEILGRLDETEEFSDALKKLEENEALKELLQNKGDEISNVSDEMQGVTEQTKGLEQTIKENLTKQNQMYSQ